jgi:hypothetical protein
MSEKDKDIPVKEREDGSAVASMGRSDNDHDEEDENDSEVEQHAEGGEVDSQDEHDDNETDEEREKIREARREERRLKKDLVKQREVSAKHKISALERRNEELARRLAAVESTAASYQFAQVDKAIEDEATRIEYAKMKLVQAAQANDAESQVEYLEQLSEAKTRLSAIQAHKRHQLENAKNPKQNVPNEISTEVQRNATDWLKKNKWYDPQARDTDSRIAKVVDQELASEGWEPSDPEYWEELDNRLSSRLPHGYSARNGTSSRRSGPTESGRSASASNKSGGSFTLSRDRVQAIKDAGAWDDPAKRSKMVNAYARFDKENRG